MNNLKKAMPNPRETVKKKTTKKERKPMPRPRLVPNSMLEA